MLRITVEPADAHITLKLEGKIKGAWVDELERCWLTLAPTVNDKRLRADFTGVSFVAPEGKALVCKMADAGVELMASGLAAQTILDEVRAHGSHTRSRHPG